MNARHARADELVQHAKGTIDVEMAEDFLADHFDSFEKKTQAMSARFADMWMPRRAV